MQQNIAANIAGARPARGLAFCDTAASDVAPAYMRSDLATPIRTIAIGEKSTLKATFWSNACEESVQLGDPNYVSIALNLGGRVWRNNERTPTERGAIALQPFEGARWRFEQPKRFMHLYVPFSLLGGVCESLLNKELSHGALRMPAGIRDDRLCSAARAVQSTVSSIEPTTLMLDSWALILAEILVREFSSHAGADSSRPFGKIPARGVARVIDYVEANIHQDLELASLASIAAMSVYHFARRFKETVGQSPHAYVLSRRVHRAQHMLQDRETGLSSVAAACGFSSQAHFTTVFQHSVGVTPGAYRRALLA